jgi:hypothetical protein
MSAMLTFHVAFTLDGDTVRTLKRGTSAADVKRRLRADCKDVRAIIVIGKGTPDPAPRPTIATCDGCTKERRDVKACGEIGLCFLCRKEGERGRQYDRKIGRYVHPEPPPYYLDI